MAASHATRTVTIEAPSPDPNGRELPIVERVTTGTILAAYGFRSRTEVSFAIPLTIDQVGLGTAGISAQHGDALDRHPPRDPRFGFAQQLWMAEGTARFSATARYTLVIPLGRGEAMAGERGFVGAPAFTTGLERGRWFATTEIGARLRQPTRFANARLGSQLWVATGVGVELLADHQLTLAAEASLAPTLVAQPDGGSAGSGTLAPAEWLVSVSTAPLGRDGPTLVLGGGGGLPSSTTVDGEAYSGIPSPARRLVAIVRQPLALPQTSAPRRRRF